MALPPFLCPHPPLHPSQPALSAVFPHASGNTYALWWPQSTPTPRTVVLFFPGNPGLIDFYSPFLSEIHSSSPDDLGILAHSYLGHSPSIPFTLESMPHSILMQHVLNAIEILDALLEWLGKGSKIILMGHSVGSWISVQVLKARESHVYACILLTPCVSNIVKSHNGARLSRLFKPPLPYLVSLLSSILHMLPHSVISAIFHLWPHNQLAVLRTLLHSPSAIYWALTMAHHEMITIKEPDLELLQKHKSKIRMYWALHDHWVSDERENLIRMLEIDEDMMHTASEVPHAFCINHHSEVAQHCIKWLSQLLQEEPGPGWHLP